MVLNDYFTHIWGQILSMDPMPSIDKVFSLVLQEEKHQKVVGVSEMTKYIDLLSKNVVSSLSNH